MLVDEAAIRIQVQTPDHVPVVGLVAASGGRILLVEAPYRYTALNEYLVAHPNADRRAMVRQNGFIILGAETNALLTLYVARQGPGDSRWSPLQEPHSRFHHGEELRR